MFFDGNSPAHGKNHTGNVAGRRFRAHARRERSAFYNKRMVIFDGFILVNVYVRGAYELREGDSTRNKNEIKSIIWRRTRSVGRPASVGETIHCYHHRSRVFSVFLVARNERARTALPGRNVYDCRVHIAERRSTANVEEDACTKNAFGKKINSHSVAS